MFLRDSALSASAASFSANLLATGPLTKVFTEGLRSCTQRTTRGFETERVQMNAKLLPVCFGNGYVVVLRSLHNICEGDSSVLIAHPQNLAESSDRVADPPSIRHWLFSLFRKGEGAIWKVASGCLVTMLVVRLPGCFHCNA